MKISEALSNFGNVSSYFKLDNNESYVDEHFCKLILYVEIVNSRIRLWDLIILIPNLIFLFYLLIRFNRARLKLRATSSPLYYSVYGLVFMNVLINVLRCALSMLVVVQADLSDTIDKLLWVIVRFFLLATEMSVVTFGLAFGRLDSRTNIKHVLLVTSIISLVFTIAQGVLEVVLPDDSFHINSKDKYLYGHGGMLFWFCSSLAFSFIYLTIFLLSRTKLRERFNLPLKRSFYIYVFILFLLDLVQSIGSGLLKYYGLIEGLCIVDLTTAIYFTFLPLLVYCTFLSELSGHTQPILDFSYNLQVDDILGDQDIVSLPHQQSYSSLKTDSDYIYQNSPHNILQPPSIDTTTHFTMNGVNPLYTASLQSPDSITGYSLTSNRSNSLTFLDGTTGAKSNQQNYSIQNL